MIDLDPLLRNEKTLGEVLEGVGVETLRGDANTLVDKVLGYLAGLTDADVVFVPEDPNANDPYAENAGDTNIAWTLGHLVVHVTASWEETAALAAEMARGVERDGRSRYETPWESVTTIQQCLDRLAESRRMVLASLEMWPAQPHLDVMRKPWSSAPELNALAYFLSGLRHGNGHLNQIEDVVQQAKAARA